MIPAEPPPALRLGRIGYLNVLPIYYPLETGILPNAFQTVAGPPARLNRLMSRGELDLSSTSSIEYARNASRYRLLPNLAIGSQGPVQSVLLLSRRPLRRLEGRTILVSSQTHTSAALLRLLLKRHLGLRTDFASGEIRTALASRTPPEAFLAIGDEALSFRNDPDFPYQLDLGQTWLDWTGLPFIFGVWVASRDSLAAWPEAMQAGASLLIEAKRWGTRRLEFFAQHVAAKGILDAGQLASYFRGLVYDLGSREREGLSCFFEHLAADGEIDQPPALRFVSSGDP